MVVFIVSVELGFSYVPKSIRARIRSREIAVEETDPTIGRIKLDIPAGSTGEVSIDYQRRILQGGAPKPTKVVGTSNACIYCGSASNLSDEHIIPYALEGEFVIRGGSCDACAKRTSLFERKILRDALLAPRTAMRLRTRRPRQRPTSLPLVRKQLGSETVIDVPVADHLTYLALPLFAPAAHLRGDPAPNIKVISPGIRAVSVSQTTIQTAARQHGNVGVRVDLDIYAFAKLLAKIAHGFVAVADLGDIEPFLPEVMFAEDESVGRWVGGAPDEKLGAEGMHVVRIETVQDEIHVRIKLFAQLGAPEYLVVAGRFTDGSDGEVVIVVE